MSLAIRHREQMKALDAAAQAAAIAPPAEAAAAQGQSLASRHRAQALGKVRAEAAASTAAVVVPPAAATEYELQKAALGVDIRRLKQIQSLERKIELKRAIVPTYDDWIIGVLSADSGAEDVILPQVMIWQIDIGNFAIGLDLADYVLKHKLELPERFDRTPATLIVEEIADAALKLLGRTKLAEVTNEELAPFTQGDDPVMARIAAIAETHDMPDQVKAKVAKIAGLLVLRRVEALGDDADGPAGALRAGLDSAREWFLRALELDDNSGVKTRIREVERAIARLEKDTAQG